MGCGRGEIDYFVREPRWGFEFRGTATAPAAEHLSRFYINGTYDQDIRSGAGWWLTVELPCRRKSVRRYWTNSGDFDAVDGARIHIIYSYNTGMHLPSFI
jgi:hypothetical protein